MMSWNSTLSSILIIINMAANVTSQKQLKAAIDVSTNNIRLAGDQNQFLKTNLKFVLCASIWFNRVRILLRGEEEYKC